MAFSPPFRHKPGQLRPSRGRLLSFCAPALRSHNQVRPAFPSMKILSRLLRRLPHRDSFPRVSCLVLAFGIVTTWQHNVNASPATADGQTLETFTGGHTRVVWLTDAENKGTFAERNPLQLVGYDSRDGKGERIICADRANYYRPLITPDGQQIVFSNR